MDPEFFNHKSLNLFINFKEKEKNSKINYSVTDENGIIIHVNQNFCEITGYTKEELIGVSHRIMSSGLHDKQFYKNLWDTIKSGYIWQGEINNVAKNGKTIWMNTVIFPVYDKKNKERRFLAIRTLINDRKKIELERDFRLSSLNELIFKISNELRQPITQIMGIVEIMKMGNISKNENDILTNYLKNTAKLLDNYSRDISKHVEEITDNELSYYNNHHIF